MTDLPPRTGDDADDALLLERARGGDSDAFGELYRREVDPARRLARILVGEDGADELVAESFARVLTQLQAGRGPTEDFRAYLQVTIRNGFRDGLRATKESPSSDQPWLLDDVLPPVEELVEDLDRDVAVTALATLPKSWQQVLWHLEVEGRKPAEVAGLLDMDAGAVSSLAYRAREGLKRAYLDQHFQPAVSGQCGWTQSRMSQYVRGDLSLRAQQKVADHLDDCDACGAALVAVDRVNQKLAAWLFPVVLWGIAGAHKGGLLWFAGAAGAGGAGGAGTTTGGSPGASGPNPLLVGAAATAVACGLAGGVAIAVLASKDEPRDKTIAAEAPVADDTSQDPPAGDQPPPGEPTDDPPPALSTDQPAASEPPATAVPSTTPPTTDPSAPTTEPSAPRSPTEPTSPTTEPPATTPTPPEPTPTSPTPAPFAIGLVGVTVDEAPDGNPGRGPFEITVDFTSTGDGAAKLKIILELDETWRLLDLTADGDWRCNPQVEGATFVTPFVRCLRTYDGTLPPLVLRAEAPLGRPAVDRPSGSARLTVDNSPGTPGSDDF